MRRIIAIIALMALALPVAAQETEDALILEMYPEPDGRHLLDGEHSGLTDGTIRAGIVGHYLWLEWGDPDRPDDDRSPDGVTFDVTDLTITKVIAYRDGTVEFIREASEPKVSEPVEVVESIDLVEERPDKDWSRLIPVGVRPL